MEKKKYKIIKFWKKTKTNIRKNIYEARKNKKII